MRKLNFFSAVTTPIVVMADDNLELGPATGFFLRRDDNWIYFVTNWHVVTGRRPERPSESRCGAVPTKLKITLHRQFSDSQISLSEKISKEIPINNENGDEPRWLEHPTHRQMVDVVVIKIKNSIEFTDGLFVNFLDEYDSFEESFFPSPMSSIFVVGYPWGLTGGDPVLPLYKRGSVASEPLVAEVHLPRFFIDCRTSDGMSGSPVICQHNGVWNPNDPMGGVTDGKLPSNAKIGLVENFAGVYSGRLISKETNMADEISELGVVWTKKALENIVEHGVPGSKLLDLAR